MDKIIVNFGGVLLAPHRIRKEASVRFISLSPRLPKGGQRHRLTIGGDSYGC